jgi:hypothetical protein
MDQQSLLGPVPPEELARLDRDQMEQLFRLEQSYRIRLEEENKRLRKE